jgi:hypothetical protein
VVAEKGGDGLVWRRKEEFRSGSAHRAAGTCPIIGNISITQFYCVSCWSPAVIPQFQNGIEVPTMMVTEICAYHNVIRIGTGYNCKTKARIFIHVAQQHVKNGAHYHWGWKNTWTSTARPWLISQSRLVSEAFNRVSRGKLTKRVGTLGW